MHLQRGRTVPSCWTLRGIELGFWELSCVEGADMVVGVILGREQGVIVNCPNCH